MSSLDIVGRTDFMAAQVKTLSFLTYLLRAFADFMRPYEETISKSVIQLLIACPPEAVTTRKELLVATRHILATDFRKGFFGQVSILLDEKVFVGSVCAYGGFNWVARRYLGAGRVDAIVARYSAATNLLRADEHAVRARRARPRSSRRRRRACPEGTRSASQSRPGRAVCPSPRTLAIRGCGTGCTESALLVSDPARSDIRGQTQPLTAITVRSRVAEVGF